MTVNKPKKVSFLHLIEVSADGTNRMKKGCRW